MYMLTETARMFTYFEILKLMMLIVHDDVNSSQISTAQLPTVYYVLVEIETSDCHLTTVILVVSFLFVFTVI